MTNPTQPTMAKRVFFATEPGWYRLELAANGSAENKEYVVWVEQKVGLATPVQVGDTHHMLAGMSRVPPGEEGAHELVGPIRSKYNQRMLTYEVVARKHD